jgi:hypothetical protein
MTRYRVLNIIQLQLGTVMLVAVVSLRDIVVLHGGFTSMNPPEFWGNGLHCYVPSQY